MMIMLNAFLCLLIAVRLFTFDRDNCRYKVKYSWLAWLMIVSSVAVFLFSFFGLLNRAYYAQMIMNVTLLVCLLKSKGNIANYCALAKAKKKEKKP
ncbi:hypothetical protein A9G11_03055 [Gilliamella sp. wkB108]|uniref:phage holin family protein n=1 Tax=Gilliamella sp. wkB108 TaxID=3120256 RepID=UPI00080E900B|nr:phage holin family protein [Gilliamella apicola]OCG24646.1 hypothetical protein A9G11_03055 [Gilliamella apicola]